MFASIHERGLAMRTLARAGASFKQATGTDGGALQRAPTNAERALYRLAERRLSRRETVVIDATYGDATALTEALEAVTVLRAPRTGGVRSLARALGTGNIDALHLFCAGSDGALMIGGEMIDPRDKAPETRDVLNALAKVFATNDGAPALTIYGTGFGMGEDGAEAALALADALCVPVGATAMRGDAVDMPIEWHVRAVPGEVELSTPSPASPSDASREAPEPADEADEDGAEPLADAFAQLRAKLLEHRSAKAAEARAARRESGAPKVTVAPSTPAGSNESPPRAVPVAKVPVAKVPVAKVPVAKRVVPTQRTTVVSGVRPEPAAVAEGNAVEAKPERARVVRRRADGSPLDASSVATPTRPRQRDTDGPQGLSEPLPSSQPSVIERPDDEPVAVSMLPFADPLSTLHELFAAQDDGASGGMSISEASEATVPTAEPADEPSITAETSDVGSPEAETTANEDVVDRPQTLPAFTMEAMLRPLEDGANGSVDVAEGLRLSLDGPRIRFTAHGDGASVEAVADVTPLGIDDPSARPIHVIGTVGETWLSLFIEGALAASVPLRALARREWRMLAAAPDATPLGAEVALLRVLDEDVGGLGAADLCDTTRRREFHDDAVWATGPLAPDEAVAASDGSTATDDVQPLSHEIAAVQSAVSAEATEQPAPEPARVDVSPAPEAITVDTVPAVAAEQTSMQPQATPSTPMPVSVPSVVGHGERTVLPGEEIALDLPHLAGCTMADVIRHWPVSMPWWMALDPIQGVACGRVPDDHLPARVAVAITSANARGTVAQLSVSLRVVASEG